MEYLKAVGILLSNEISSIRKKKDVPMHPIFEAMTNSFEAIRDRFGTNGLNNGYVYVDLYREESPLSIDPPLYDFVRITIRDNGIGLNDEGFERIKSLRDNTKGYHNNGTGRIQFIHAFLQSSVEGYSNERDGSISHRKVTLSKAEDFLRHNAILRIDFDEKSDSAAVDIGTEVEFKGSLNEKDKEFFNKTTALELRKLALDHFLASFCNYRNALPLIRFRIILGETVAEEACIASTDIPVPYKEGDIEVSYSKLDDQDKVVATENKEVFHLTGFRLGSEQLTHNMIQLVSKGEASEELSIADLSANDVIGDYRFLFLLSGEYIDNSDSDTRGNLTILSEREFKKQGRTLFDEPIILRDSIEEAANVKIRAICPEIAERKAGREVQIDDLQKMFLLNPEAVKAIRNKIKNTDSDEAILRKFYQADSEIAASKDAEIKRVYDQLNKLDPTSETYQDEMSHHANQLVSLVPMQSRSALAQYVARRKLVLEMFQKILNQELSLFATKKRIDENLLHNLIFQQHSDDPISSDLWLISDEFLYFKGVSEERFLDVKYKDERVFSKELREDDKKALYLFGEDRLSKRPDVLLFPEEGKCLLIEFKAPDVNVSEHLSQLDFYASLLLNYSNPKFKISTFYSCLIGESLSDRDIRGRDSSYIQAPGFEYWYRPAKPVAGYDGIKDGCHYSEVFKYSSLLKRAIQRNKIFIEKLGLHYEDRLQV